MRITGNEPAAISRVPTTVAVIDISSDIHEGTLSTDVHHRR
ncbi:hypothetical protein HNP40_001842 [Mycobacteroides chelonae]|nr:hypothetical protein [Mycobacteroides chelonae]